MCDKKAVVSIMVTGLKFASVLNFFFGFSHWLCSLWPRKLGTSCYLCLEHYFPAFCLVNSYAAFRHQFRCCSCRRVSLTHSPHASLDAPARLSQSPPCLKAIEQLPYYYLITSLFYCSVTSMRARMMFVLLIIV